MRADGIFGQAVDRIGGEPISARMARRAPIRHLDPTLLFATLVLTAFGAAMIYSTTASKQVEAGLDPGLFLKRQIAFLIGGGIILFIVSFLDYRHFRAFAPVIYGSAILALILVLTPAGAVVSGARRWINLGAFQFQPSELAKIAVLMALAAYLAERKGEVRARDIAISLGMVAVPSLLIFLEPDLGTAMVLTAVMSVLLLVGGAKIRHFVAIAFVAIIAIVGAIQLDLIHDYQIQRLTAFMDPNPDVQSEGYNLVQAKIAIASGGARGKGFQAPNTQTTLDFVPEQHTDFIFTAVGEQLGLMGSATLLGLFAFLIWRALRIATMSRDMFGTLLAAGIAGLWIFQIFINMGMTMGIMPITGIPLPFISYGGSSLITNYICVGILLNVHMRRFL
ncbi:MAG: rod shape determining protein RodA [Actinomycetota bacterium]|nr:rod shape determining protein RodA [Actinomycetota bacterium]